MLKIAICDDEKMFCDAAEYMLNLYMEDKSMAFQADVFGVPSRLIDATEKGTVYDIYLLDIYMPGITGMSIATELRSRGVQSPIIFLTSSTDHALEAFGVNATHYLLKPYSREHFYAGMDKALQSITSHKDDSIVLKVDNEYRSISVAGIIYCQSEDKYQRLYLESGEKLLVRMSGAELYKQLSQSDSFYHCGRAHIINFDYISRVTADSAIFKNGTILKLPHTVLAPLKKAFFDYFN